MTVNIVASGTSGGDSLADTNDLGSVSPSGTSTVQDVFIRHDAVVASITDCAFYIVRHTGGTYLGSDADEDYSELLDWGYSTYTGATPVGGLAINQVIPPSWEIGEEFDSGDWVYFYFGSGDIDHQLTLKQTAINQGSVSEDGVIPVAGEAHVQVKWEVPSSVPNGAGYRAITLVFAYSATS